MVSLTPFTRRKLDDILRELIPLEQRGNITRFLNSTEDVKKLSDLAEDIRDTMMDYQVCPRVLTLTSPDIICIRHHCNKTSMKRVVGSL